MPQDPKLEIEGLNPTDELLWQSMEALAHCLRELNRFQYAGNYGDAITVFHKLEQHFGVSSGDNLVAALQELVDLKDLKTRVYGPFDKMGVKTASEVQELRDNYNTRKPIAWERARALLRKIK